MATATDTRLFGKSIKRREDPRFITGRGNYTDDLKLPGMTYAAFVRSPHAHAKIRKIDVAKAKAHPGVVAIFTGKDLTGVNSLPCGWLLPDLKVPPHPPLAVDTVRYVGDPVAIVIAESQDAALDAAEKLKVDWEIRPAVTATAKAADRGAAQIHEVAPSNVAFKWQIGDAAAVDAAVTSAAVVVKKRIVNQRLVANAMEPRACVARFDAATGDLTLWVTSQNPHVHRLLMTAFVLGIPEHKVRVIAADVGGDHAHLVLGDAEHERRHQQPVDVGVLRGHPEREVAGGRVEAGHARARLHGVGHEALVDDPFLDDDRRARDRRVHGRRIADLPLEGDVRRRHLVDLGGAPVGRLGGGGDGGPDLPVHLQLLGGVQRRVLALGDDDGDGITDVAHGVDGERRVRRHLEVRQQPAARQRVHPGEVLAGEDRDHAGVRLRLGDVDLADLRVRVWAAHERRIGHAGQLEVVGVVTPARDESRILATLDGFAEQARVGRGGHGAPSLRFGHVLRSPLDRLHDVVVAGAPAQVAFELVADLLLRRFRIALEQLAGGQNHAGRAEAALQAVLLPETLLDRMQVPVLREPLNGGDLGAVRSEERR